MEAKKSLLPYACNNMLLCPKNTKSVKHFIWTVFFPDKRAFHYVSYSITHCIRNYEKLINDMPTNKTLFNEVLLAWSYHHMHFTSLIDEKKKDKMPLTRVTCLMIVLTWLIAKLVLLPCHQNIQNQGPHLEREGLKRSCIALP